MSRVPYDNATIEDIDTHIHVAGLHNEIPFLRDIAANSAYYAKKKENQASILTLETCLGEIIVEIAAIIEGTNAEINAMGIEEAQFYLSMHFSQWDIPFEDMKEIDLQAANHNRCHWISFLEEPSKKVERKAKAARAIADQSTWKPCASPTNKPTAQERNATERSNRLLQFTLHFLKCTFIHNHITVFSNCLLDK